MEKHPKYVKPARFAELEIIKAIVNEEWPVKSNLPPERELAGTLGITRPTLREVLQRLSRDGWITITHGKPSIVNDYKKDGGLGILNSLVNFDEFFPSELVGDWLEFRVILFPELAYKAILSNPDEVIKKLNAAPKVSASAAEFAIYDWGLQLLLINNCGNSIAKMLYNDLANLYHRHGSLYFEKAPAKTMSFNYYNALKHAIMHNKEGVPSIINNAMQESAALWDNLQKLKR